jgi:hypothetical protein
MLLSKPHPQRREYAERNGHMTTKKEFICLSSPTVYTISFWKQSFVRNPIVVWQLLFSDTCVGFVKITRNRFHVILVKDYIERCNLSRGSGTTRKEKVLS